MTSVFSELRGEVPLAVYIDLKSPYAYLAIDPTRAMAAAADVPVDWRPFTLDIPSYLGSAKLDAKGKVASSKRTPQQWSGVKYSYMDCRRYANLTGKTVRGTVKIWDTRLAGIALLWAKEQGPQLLDRYLDEVYQRFWRRDLDAEDLAAFESVLVEVGAATEGLRVWAEGRGGDRVDDINRTAFTAGVFGVPTYLVGDEMWFGREHLPRVAWLLAGGVGEEPDVGNRAFAR
jgi:2-hydroxychromene-2-carboxylate isomerase